jgi:LAS superfamily LD-carboxypeptidase LdcB
VAGSIAGNLRDLLAAAGADGVGLCGWGYRSPERQVQLRRQHCGTSHYAVYEMPSSQCSPPTARPGFSMHEQGLAVDFTCDGGSISSRGNRCFRWLAGNAGRYGFQNLPSEPWHWSTNGR